MKDLKFLDKDQTIISMIDENGNKLYAVKGNNRLYDEAVQGKYGKITPFSEVEKKRRYNEDVVVEKVKLKYILLKYKLLSDLEYIISNMDEFTKLSWNDSVYINKKSKFITLLQKSVKFPDGSDITKEDINEIFIEAEKLEIM